MDTLNRWARLWSVIAVALLLILPATGTAFAQDGREATTLRIGAPARLAQGERGTVQAVLTDSAGKPIGKAVVVFTSPANFLNNSGDTVVGSATTNKSGQAVFAYDARNPGSVTLTADYRGDERYAPAQATAQIEVSGGEQLYVEHPAVHIPLLNTPPFVNPWAAVKPPQGLPLEISALWPAMTGWPIAAVLIVVWSLYVFVSVMIFRVSAAGRSADDAAPAAETEV